MFLYHYPVGFASDRFGGNIVDGTPYARALSGCGLQLLDGPEFPSSTIDARREDRIHYPIMSASIEVSVPSLSEKLQFSCRTFRW